MIKEVILGIVSLLGIGIALSKRDIIFTVITFGLAAGAFIYILGVQTINISSCSTITIRVSNWNSYSGGSFKIKC